MAESKEPQIMHTLSGLRVIVDHHATARGDRVLCLPWKPFEYKQVPGIYKFDHCLLVHPALMPQLKAVFGGENRYGS